MEARRILIIEAAEKLILKTESTNFSMIDLARTAGLSTATTYNLIGSKATVLYRLLNRTLDRLNLADIRYKGDGDPIGHVLEAAETAVNVFANDPGFYRPLMRFLLGVPDAVHRPLFMARAYGFWLIVVQCLTEEKILRPRVDLSDIARDLHVFFAGALDLWVHEELDDKQFRAQVRHGTAIHLLGVTDKNDERLLDQLVSSRQTIQPLYPASANTE